MKEFLAGTQFEHELVKALQTFIPNHMKDCLSNLELDYESYGTEVEKKLKLIFKNYYKIRIVLTDIGLTLNFLKKERSQIIEHYPFLHDQEAYFTYHYENYFIRLVTMLDLIGKLGTLLYDLDLPLEKVSAYTMKDKAQSKGYTDLVNITKKMINGMSDLKVERHKKLHTGEADIKIFNGIVIWEDLDAITGLNTDQILIKDSDEKIKEKIETLETSTVEFINIVKEFLEESNTKLKEIITSANNNI